MRRGKPTLCSPFSVYCGRGTLVTLVSVLALACGPGPLPPENPKTQPDQPAEPIPVSVEKSPAATSTGATSASALPVQSSTESKSPADNSASKKNNEGDKATSSAQPIVIKGVGFQSPESVLYVSEDNSYLVSNVNGSPSGVDNNGFISKVAADGQVTNLKFIEGGRDGVELNAPKGMAKVGNLLYVADINHVRVFEFDSGKPKPAIPFANATFLNDICARADGALFISDSGLKMGKSGLEPSGTDSVYKLFAGKVSVFARGPALAGPNGIYADASNVWVVTLGKNQLLRFDAKGKLAETADVPGGGLDGLAALPNGKFLVSSWQTKTVYLGDSKAGFTPLLESVASPADMGWDDKNQKIAIPVFLENEVRLVPVALGPL